MVVLEVMRSDRQQEFETLSSQSQESSPDQNTGFVCRVEEHTGTPSASLAPAEAVSFNVKK